METQTIIKYCKKYIDLSDRDIVGKIIRLKMFERYKNPSSIDTLRRRISTIRQSYELRIQKKDPTNDIISLLRKYPEATVASLAHKLRLNYPHFTVRTLESRIYNTKKYGEF